MGFFNHGCGGCLGNNGSSWEWVINLIIIIIALEFLCGIFGGNFGGCGNNNCGCNNF